MNPRTVSLANQTGGVGKATVVLTAAAALTVLAGCTDLLSELDPVPEADATVTQSTTVVRVIDGDTIAVQPTDELPATNDDGNEHVVRLLGIDAPEMNFYDDEDPECGAQAATDYLAELLPEAAAVTVVYDERADETDRYGRSLAYIESPETEDAGLAMLTEGHAAAWVPQSAPDPERLPTYEDAMTTAQRDRTGSWAQCPAIGRAGANA